MTRRGLIADSLRRLLTSGRAIDGRSILVGAVAACLAAVAAGHHVWGANLWPYLGVPPGPSIFFDARNLTAAWECDRLGYDPLYDNPCDPRGRPLMYLRPWLLLGTLGLDQSHTFAFASVLIVAMFAAFGLLVGRVPLGTGLALAIAACSPAVMLALERANMDIALFSFVAIAIVLWRTLPSAARIVSPILVLLAAIAKIYPVFALAAFAVSGSRVAARAALACGAAFGIYCAFNFRDVTHVAEIAIQGQHFSYGARILPAHLYHQVGAEPWAGPAALKQLLAALPLGLVAAVIAVRLHRSLSVAGEAPAVASAQLLALYVGALIYLGTFAVANNFDYRLVFLLLTLPQLIAWASSPAHKLSSLGLITAVAVLVLLWVGSLSERLNLWDELASWAVAALLVTVLAATVPPPATVLRRVIGGSPRGFRPHDHHAAANRARR